MTSVRSKLLRHPLLIPLTALLGGSLFPLGLAPLGLWPLTFISVAGAALLLRQPKGHRFLLGWLYGLGAFGVGTSWVSASMAVSGTPFVLSVLLTSLFCAGLALLFGLQFWLYSKLRVTDSWLEAPVFLALWLLFEWLRSWLLTGFPWLYAGYALTDTWLSGFAPLIGVFGLSALVAGLASLGAIAGATRRKTSILWAATLSLLITAAGWTLQQTDWVAETGVQVDAVIVQGNVDQKTKWDGSNIQVHFDQYLAQSLPHTDSDLIIWPEAAITALHSRATPFLTQLESLGDSTQTGFVTGIIMDPVVEGRRRFYNAAMGLGTASGAYNKTRMVPFGEYVPFANAVRGLLSFFDLPMSALEPGDSDAPPLLLGQIRLGMLICYEIAYPEMALNRARNSDIILTISNDAWFGVTFGPYQHLEMARMRAMEVGRPIIRATQDGVSAFIDHRGTLVSSIAKQEQATLRASVTLVTGETPYTRWGYLWQIVLGLIIVLFAASRLGGVKPRRTDTKPSAG